MRTLDPTPRRPPRVLTPASEGKVSSAVDYYVTPHAKDRYLERVGGCRRGEADRLIVETITAGVEAGRRTKHKPRWLEHDNYRTRNTNLGKVRYVHDEAKEICFVVHERSLRNKKIWWVVTCMRRRALV